MRREERKGEESRKVREHRKENQRVGPSAIQIMCCSSAMCLLCCALLLCTIQNLYITSWALSCSSSCSTKCKVMLTLTLQSRRSHHSVLALNTQWFWGQHNCYDLWGEKHLCGMCRVVTLANTLTKHTTYLDHMILALNHWYPTLMSECS